MWRAGWIGVAALVCVGCEHPDPAAKQTAVEPCSLLTENDAIALLGRPTVKSQFGRGACTWNLEFPDHSISSLSLKVQTKSDPIIIVSKSEITLNGKPYASTPEPSTVEQVPIGRGGVMERSPSVVHVKWRHGDMRVELTLLSAGPSTFTAASKTEQMTRLAQKVDAALR